MKKIKRRPNKKIAKARPASNKHALITITQRTRKLPGVFSATGWRPPKRMSEKQWTAAGKVLSEYKSGVQWWIGDWWNSGEPYGDRVDTVREQFSLSYAAVRQYGAVCKNVCIRLDTLSFRHHAEVAYLPEAEQRHWLRLAERKGWSVAEMESAMMAQPEPALGNASDADSTDLAAITAPPATDQTEPGQSRALEHIDRVPQLMSAEDQHRFNLNTAWALLVDVVKQPRSIFRHPRGTAEEARAFASFFDGMALDMSDGGIVAAPNEPTKEEERPTDAEQTRPSAM